MTRSTPIRLLVVDDDEMSRELLTVLLEAEGYGVMSADSGEAALAQLGQPGAKVDVVLTDMQMPGTTGDRLASELRRVCGPATLLLAMSGSKPAKRALARFDGFLLKPFKVEEIAAVLGMRVLPGSPAKAPARPRRRLADVAGLAGRSQSMPEPLKIHASTGESASYPGMNTQGFFAPSGDPAGNDQSFGVSALNETIYGQLAASMPARQLHEMYEMCLNDARDRIRQMRTFVADHDSVRFVREAHSIKGGCGMLGATELHGMAARLEKGGIEAMGGGINSSETHEVNSLDELDAACDRLERILSSRS
jgi:CheY-like chemotaxis protein